MEFPELNICKQWLPGSLSSPLESVGTMGLLYRGKVIYNVISVWVISLGVVFFLRWNVGFQEPYGHNNTCYIYIYIYKFVVVKLE